MADLDDVFRHQDNDGEAAHATEPQAKFIRAILDAGGYRIPGSKVFGKREHPVTIKASTIAACKIRGWVIREEVAGEALWTVTILGEGAVAGPA